MQKTTTIVLIAALALVTAALVSVTFAQTATPNPTNTPSKTVAPWCINPNTAAPYCYNNGTCINGNCINNCAVCASGNCYNADAGYCAGSQGAPQACSQYGYGNQQDANVYQGGRMGHCGRGW
jgi:hypothetical protein